MLIDAINKITGTSDLYTSPIPEPFTYIPDDKPAIAIADGSITSPFLALFGRSARATGMENERNNKPMPAQWLHMLNSSHIQRKLDQGPKLKAIFESGRKPAEIIDELYLTILSRPPTPAEVKSALEYGSLAPGKKSAAAAKRPLRPGSRGSSGNSAEKRPTKGMPTGILRLKAAPRTEMRRLKAALPARRANPQRSTRPSGTTIGSTSPGR